MPKLFTKSISKSYGTSKIIEDISITLNKSEIVSLLGVSGIGKTTIFNIISGLILPDTGNVFLDDKDVTGKVGHIGYMQQKDLLLPYKKIIDNVSLPLVIRGEKKKDARIIAKKLFEQFGIDGYENKYPSQLSGGMRQRAALLRTYFLSKKVVLLDEPFSALDILTKSDMHNWYMDLAHKLNMSTLFITHDIDEAITLSDRIYILSGKPGKIVAQINVELEKTHDMDFKVSDRFTYYKKEIMKFYKAD